MAEDKQQRKVRERRELYKSLGFLSSVGICVVVSILIGMVMGFYLDQWLGTAPWMLLIFLGLGIVSGFRNIFILTNRELERQKRISQDDSGQSG
jgi:ATP synthase protein I